MHSIFSNTDKTDGISLYWNDEELVVEQYHHKQKQYYCGKELLRFDTVKTKVYTLLVVDFDESYCAEVYSNGEIKKKFHMVSDIPKKQKCGGQSAKRFAQNRENAITAWYKDINQNLMRVQGPIYVSINFVYKNRFMKYMHSYVKDKITRFDKNEYGGLTGIYQYINLLEREKGNKTGI